MAKPHRIITRYPRPACQPGWEISLHLGSARTANIGENVWKHKRSQRAAILAGQLNDKQEDASMRRNAQSDCMAYLPGNRQNLMPWSTNATCWAATCADYLTRIPLGAHIWLAAGISSGWSCRPAVDRKISILPPIWTAGRDYALGAHVAPLGLWPFRMVRRSASVCNRCGGSHAMVRRTVKPCPAMMWSCQFQLRGEPKASRR